MKKYTFSSLTKYLFIFFTLFFYENVIAQYQQTPQSRSPFWNNVQFGGGLGLSFGSGYTEISVAPSAIYNINPYLAMGLGLQASYVSSKNYFTSLVYGVSTMVLVNPIPQIQFSLGLNQSRVNYQEEGYGNYSEDYWDTSLILGAGYRTGNVTIGIGYNLLQNDRYDTEPFVPFVRAYF